MSTSSELIFFHAPQSRSTGVLNLLEELNADYKMHLLNLQTHDELTPEYRAINPMSKVPAIKHGDALVTEQAAVYMYLAELFPKANLAPAIGDPLRGPYLRWMVFYGSCFEPGVIDHSQKNPPTPPSTCPYSDYDTMLKTVSDQLEKGPFMLGERYTALDVLWGNALNWTMMFGIVPKLPVFTAYVTRVTSRPAFVRASEKEAALVAAQALPK